MPFAIGSLVRARGREWVVLPESEADLLVIHSLTCHREVTARSVAEICQRSLEEAREILSCLVARWNILEAGGGAGRGRYYRLSRALVQAVKRNIKRFPIYFMFRLSAQEFANLKSQLVI